MLPPRTDLEKKGSPQVGPGGVALREEEKDEEGRGEF